MPGPDFLRRSPVPAPSDSINPAECVELECSCGSRVFEIVQAAALLRHRFQRERLVAVPVPSFRCLKCGLPIDLKDKEPKND